MDAPGLRAGGVTGGFVTPRNFLGIIMMVAVVLVDPAGLRTPPESTLAVSPVLESILGVWLFFVCNDTI